MFYNNVRKGSRWFAGNINRFSYLAIAGFFIFSQALFLLNPRQASATAPFFNGFESDTASWNNSGGGTIAREASGPDGLASSDGGFHAIIDGPVYTDWGGYESSFPVNGYTTELDVYLDMDLADGSDLRFDFSSAINKPNGDHRRDFILHLGTNPGVAGQWAVSASNNAPGWPLNPDRNPAEITDSGWYTLQHVFEDDGTGILKVTLAVIDSDGDTIGSWVLSDASDIIGDTIGGNRYGWFTSQRFDFEQLAIDNSSLQANSPSVPYCLTTEFQNGNNPSIQTTETCIDAVDCSLVSVSADRELSNIIVLYQDGTYVKYDGADFGDTQKWDIPQDTENYGPIVAVWIHAGNNHNSDDPDPEEFNNGNSVGRYHQIPAPDCNVLGEECEAGPGWASEVTNNQLGTKKGGAAITGARAETVHALGEPDATTGPDDGFYSLGQDGWIVVEFDGYVTDEPDSVDLSFHEVTNGRNSYPLETIAVEVSQDGTTWVPVGSVTNKDGGDGVGYLDFTATGFSWIKYVRITETSDFSLHTTGADGYDLDAVDATNIECEKPELDLQPCEVGNNIFQIGQNEVDQLQNPADEFSWNGVFGDFSQPTDDPFVVPFSPDSRFPWNSNFGQGAATDFEVEFYYNGGEPLPEALLTVAWSPGKSATETKQIYLNGNLIGTTSHVGVSTPNWFNNMEVFDDTFVIEDLTPGWHTLRLTHTQGDGTMWDFVRLQQNQCVENSASIQGRKYHDVNNNGNFDNAEKQAQGDPNRLNDWLISLYDDNWNLVKSMETGDDNTEAGNVAKGQYRFENLGVGTYYVCEELVEGWVQTEPSTGPQDPETKLNCFEIEITSPDQVVNTVQFGNYEAIGQIAGVVYNDQNNNLSQDEGEPELEGWQALLLTRNSPFTVHSVDTTGIDGAFTFENLAYGTYFVCENIQSGWLQTELNEAGFNDVIVSTLSAGDLVGDSPELDALIAEFCYEVELTPENSQSLANNFGNFQEEDEEDEGPQLLGVSTTVDPEDEEGSVLAAADTLSDTGQYISLYLLSALAFIAGAAKIVRSRNS